MVKNLTLTLIILFIVITGAQLLMGGKGDDVKESAKKIGYIAIGAVFVYGAGWLFGQIFDMNAETNQNLQGFVDQAIEGDKSLGFQVLSLLKGGAFFFAIIMLVVTGFRVIAAADEEKSKQLVKGVVNVLVALIMMKSVDFVYMMFAQENVVQNLTETIKDLAKVFGYIYGALATGIVIFAGYSLITANGNEESWKKARNRMINLVLSGIVLFGFLLILYQLFSEFGETPL